MTKVPILLLIFNRPESTYRVLESIRLVKPMNLYIASDGPRTNRIEESEIVYKLRQDVMNAVDWTCDVKTLFRDKNLGCQNAVSSAISWFFKNEEMGIILEDDCVPNLSFYHFVEELLIKYKDDLRVWQISGRNGLGKYLPINIDYHFATGGSIWGWATWSSRWKFYESNLDNLSKVENLSKLKDFLCDDNAFIGHLKAIETMKNNSVDSWAYRWSIITKINNGLSIIPSVNMVRNIGFGENATHTKSKNSEEYLIPVKELDFPIKHPETVSVDRTISKIQDANTFGKLLKIKNKLRGIPLLYGFLRLIKHTFRLSI